jgi:hypothetical protein
VAQNIIIIIINPCKTCYNMSQTYMNVRHEAGVQQHDASTAAAILVSGQVNL